MISDYVKSNIIISRKNVIKKFEAHQIYGANKKFGRIYVYGYVFFSTICSDNGQLKERYGGSNPVVFIIKENKNTFNIIKHKEPLLGEDFPASIKRIFPKKYADYILKSPHKKLVQFSKREEEKIKLELNKLDKSNNFAK